MTPDQIQSLLYHINHRLDKQNEALLLLVDAVKSKANGTKRYRDVAKLLNKERKMISELTKDFRL